MSVILVLIGVSLLMSAGFVFICISAIRDGQFDDLESPRWRVLFSDLGDTPYVGSAWSMQPPPGIKQNDSH